MKKLCLFIGVLFAINVTAQSRYEQGMLKAFELWGKGKLTESANLFERISKAEKDNWLPSYYAGYVTVLSSFGVKKEAELKVRLDKANAYLKEAAKISPNNPEIMIIQALHNTAYIAFDGQKYGMSLSGKNVEIYTKAIAIAPNNPRVILGKAEWDMGGAKFFGKPVTPYCKDIQRALELFKAEKVTKQFYPSWGKERAEQVLAQSCGKK
jgi:tetratricopeptide (TPR) repeat protein